MATGKAKILLTVLAVVAGLAALAAPAANATDVKGSALLQRKQTLAADPTPKMAVSCQSRTITLAGGYYQWDQYVWYTDRAEGIAGHVILASGDSRENIKLASDKYTWSSCLYPQNNEYYQISSLTRASGTDHGTALLEHTYGTPDNFWHTGAHYWGDDLLFFGNTPE